jgi:hypothetical protein
VSRGEKAGRKKRKGGKKTNEEVDARANHVKTAEEGEAVRAARCSQTLEKDDTGDKSGGGEADEVGGIDDRSREKIKSACKRKLG